MTDELLVDYSVTMAMLLGSLNTSASKMKVMAKLNQFYSRKYWVLLWLKFQYIGNKSWNCLKRKISKNIQNVKEASSE